MRQRRIDPPPHRTQLISYQVVGQQKNNLNCLIRCELWTEQSDELAVRAQRSDAFRQCYTMNAGNHLGGLSH